MQVLHTINISFHVLAGTIALLVGLISLFARKSPGIHTRYGRYFLRLLAIVVGTGFVGLVLFRTSSFLLMITLLAGYVGYAGYRTIRLRQCHTSVIDALIAITALTMGVLYLLWLKQSGEVWAPSIIYSTLSALVLVTTYDLLKHVWLHEQLKTWWLYEHIYKMVSAYSAILSAFTGTILPAYKPYSQIGPLVICLGLIAYFIGQQVRLSATKTAAIPAQTAA